MTVFLVGFVIIALYFCIEMLTRRLFSFLESEVSADSSDGAACCEERWEETLESIRTSCAAVAGAAAGIATREPQAILDCDRGGPCE